MREGKSEGKKRTKSETGRGTYAKQACNHCRRRKTKCDGQEPVCGPCRDTGRGDECTWGKETAKRARTQQHFESLVNRIHGLEHKVKELEAELEQSRGGAGSSSSSIPASSPGQQIHSDNQEYAASEDDLLSSGASSQDSEIEELIAPTRHLMLQSNELELYGPTSLFRMAPERSSPSLPASPDLIPRGTSYFDWCRHLPPEIPLSRAEHDRLMDLLFKFFGTWCLRVIPELFIRDMHRALTLPPTQTPPKSAHYSPMLHNAMVALALGFADDPELHDINTRTCYLRKAKSYLEAECQKPTVSLVTALSVISYFHSTQGDQSLGYVYFGMSGRISQALGLSIDCSPLVKSGLITEADMLDRNWAYWATIAQDTCWSIYVGRDFAVPAPPKPWKFPIPFLDSELDHTVWPWASPSQHPVQPSYAIRTFAATCELLDIARNIFLCVNALRSGTRRTTALQLVSEIDIQLNDWKDSLPPEVDITPANRPTALPHRLMLHITYWWQFILLHRPFYRRAKTTHHSGIEIDHIKLCNRAAENIMQLLAVWHERYTLRYIPLTLIQATFGAGTIFLLSAVAATSGPRLGRVTLTQSLSQMDLCIQYLTTCGRSWNCANVVRDILAGVFQQQVRPRIFRLLHRPSDLPLLQSGPGGIPSPPADMSTPAGRRHDPSSSPTTPVPQPAPAPPEPARAAHDDYEALSPPYNPALWGYPLAMPGASASGAVYPDLFDNPYGDRAFNPEDIDMDFQFPADMAIVGGQPLPNEPYMAFGLPGLGVDAPANTQQKIALDFSDEEIMMMDQILKQQMAKPQGEFRGYPQALGGLR